MKLRTFLRTLPLLLALGLAYPVQALEQSAIPVFLPAASTDAAQLSITPDRPDWTYPLGSGASFRVRFKLDPYPAAGMPVSYRVADVLPWVENTLRWTHQADPQAQLHINEFHILSKQAMRQRYIELVRSLQARKAPLHGLGIQAHEPREMWFATPEIVAAFDQLGALGLPLHITEFTPQSNGKPITGGWREGSWTEAAQADFAEQFYTLAFGHPAVASIHWWGLSEKSIWLPGGGLLDARMQPKPAYERLRKLIRQDWMTRGLQLRTNAGGSAAFRGFYGRYALTLTRADGVSKSVQLHLSPGQHSGLTIEW